MHAESNSCHGHNREQVGPNNWTFKWSTLVEEKRELWPIAYLLPNGAHIH